MTYLFTIVTIIPQKIDSVAAFPRSCYAYGSIVGLIATLIICMSDKNNKLKEISLIVPVVVMMLIELVQFHKIEANRYLVNDIVY